MANEYIDQLPPSLADPWQPRGRREPNPEREQEIAEARARVRARQERALPPLILTAISHDIRNGVMEWDHVYLLDLLDEHRRDIAIYVAYQDSFERHEQAQKRALPLLRRLLTKQQRRSLSRSQGGGFLVAGSAGGVYRLYPHGQLVVRCVNIKGRWFDAIGFCYHDPDRIMCNADEAIGVMLKLKTDELGFLEEANPSRLMVTRKTLKRWGFLPESFVPADGNWHACQMPEWA